MLQAGVTSIGKGTIETTLLYFAFASGTLALPIWLYHTLSQQAYTFEVDQVIAWRRKGKLWNINRVDINRIMYSVGANGIMELTIYQHKGKTRTLSCPDDLNKRIKLVLSQWNEVQTQA